VDSLEILCGYQLRVRESSAHCASSAAT